MQDKPPLDQALLDLRVDWRAWPIQGAPRFVRNFESGLNHRAFVIESANLRYVLKLFKSPIPLAVAAQRWAAKLSLSPKVLYSPRDGRYMLMEFADGKNLQGTELTSENIDAIAQSLKTLHGEPIDQTIIANGHFDYLGFCQTYLENCDPQIRKKHDSLLSTLNVFTQDKTPSRFCHNDLVASNCVFSSEQVVLLDWEFAQINNPWFDLVSIIYYLKLNKSHAQRFLNTYQTDLGSSFEQNIYYATLCAVVWIDTLWHLHTFGSIYLPKLTEKMADVSRFNDELAD
jgi:thiamine kinase-like enzyme